MEVKVIRAGEARVFMDGLSKGTTPLAITGVAPSDHIIEVDMEGFFGWTTVVRVKSGAVNTVNAVLKPVADTPTGWIQVDSIPSGADIYLNGAFLGTTPGQGSFTIDRAPVGDHVITLRLNGYEPLNVPVTVLPAQIATVNGVLKAAQNLTTGSVSVASSPQGADLYIDNQLRGITPATIGDVQPGDHSILVRKQGYQDASISLSIPGGRTTEVTIPMVPLPAATTAAAGPLFALIAAVFAGIVLFRKIS